MVVRRSRPIPRPRPVPTISPTPTPTPSSTYTLTTNIETLPAAGVTAAANAVFTAPAGVTPQGVQANTLQSGDVLNGSGQQNVLNATFVNAAAIAPTINNIPTVNITSLVAGANLNLGASTAIGTIGDINSTAAVNISGVTSPIATLNKTGGIARDTVIQSQSAVLNGANNALQINLSGVDGGNINASSLSPSSTNGYETFNVAVTGASTVDRLIAGPSLDNITVSGSALEIEGEAGFTALDPGLLSFNASAMTGPLIVGNIENGVSPTEGASVVNAAAENLNFVGSNSGTVLFAESGSLVQGNTLNGGNGANDRLVLTGGSVAIGANGVVQPNSGAFTASAFETLEITDTRGSGVGVRPFNNPANFNLANVSGVNTLQLGTVSNSVVGLTNLKYTSPLAINVTGTGESSVDAANGVNAVFSGAFGDADTVNYTFGNRGRALNTNNNLNNGALTLPNIENINLVYNDFSPNTRLANEIFNGGTSNVRFLSVNASSGDSRRSDNSITGLGGSIQLGEIGDAVGGRSVKGGEINSAASVSALLNNQDGSFFLVSGNGDHNINVSNVAGASSSINASMASGDIRLNVELNTGTGSAFFAGGLGNDLLRGGGGNDILAGNDQNDNLRGFNGIDNLNGGDNSDLLDGGELPDVLTGGAGGDLFFYEGLAGIALDTGITLETADVITDFNSASGDEIVVRNIQNPSAFSGSPANYGEAAPSLDFATALLAANNFFSSTPGGIYYLTGSITDATGLLFVNTFPMNTMSATAVIRLNGIDSNNFTFTDIVGALVR